MPSGPGPRRAAQVASTGAAVAAALVLAGSTRTRRVEAQTDIDSQPGRVWWVLTDFPGYAEWNPLFAHASGRAKIDEQVDLRLAPSGGPELRFVPEVTICRAGRHLEMRGRHLIPGMLESKVSFKIEPLGKQDRVRCKAELTFKGVRTLLLPPSFESVTEAALVGMLAEVKARAEGQAAAKADALTKPREAPVDTNRA